MQLEILEQQWQALNSKLEHSLALQTEMMRQIVLLPAQKRINHMAFWPILDLVFALAVLVSGGIFMRVHWQQTALLLPSITSMIGMLALAITSIWQLQLISELEWSGPVVKLQHTLNRLRVSRIHQFKWIMLLSPLVGWCMFIVGIQWLLEWTSEGRVNIVEKLPQAWVIGNYLFGIIFVPVGYLAARFLAQHCQRYPWWQSVLDGISGKSLHLAQTEVERWRNLQ
jgi:hypothetical protein